MSEVRIAEDELCELYFFIKSDFLKSKLREKDVEDEIERERAKGRRRDKNERWDTPARNVIGEKMRKWLRDYHFSSRTLADKLEKIFDYEKRTKGQNRNIKRTKVFSCSCYPDMFFNEPVKIAIELDHGKKGSALKNALIKASFDNLSGDWKRVFVMFFDESNEKKITKSLNEEMSKKALRFYEENLNTEVVVI